MRIISGGAEGAGIAEMYSALRDNPIDPALPYADQLAMVKCRTDFVAPSRSHVKLIRRAGNGNIPSPREYPAKREELCLRDQQREFYKRVVAELGGTPTIVGVQEPHKPRPAPGVYEPKPLTAEQLALYKQQRIAEAVRIEVAETGQQDLFL